MSKWIHGTVPIEDLARVLRAAYLSGYLSKDALGRIAGAVATMAIHPSQHRLFMFKSGAVDTMEVTT